MRQARDVRVTCPACLHHGNRKGWGEKGEPFRDETSLRSLPRNPGGTRTAHAAACLLALGSAIASGAVRKKNLLEKKEEMGGNGGKCSVVGKPRPHFPYRGRSKHWTKVQEEGKCSEGDADRYVGTYCFPFLFGKGWVRALFRCVVAPSTSIFSDIHLPQSIARSPSLPG